MSKRKPGPAQAFDMGANPNAQYAAGTEDTPPPVTIPRRYRGREGMAYLAWVREKPCVLCGIAGQSEAHHHPHKRMGRGGDWDDHLAVPLCGACHRQAHQVLTPSQTINILKATIAQLLEWERRE